MYVIINIISLNTLKQQCDKPNKIVALYVREAEKKSYSLIKKKKKLLFEPFFQHSNGPTAIKLEGGGGLRP